MSRPQFNAPSTFVLVLLWFGLVALAGLFAYTCYEMVIIAGVWLTKHDAIRPSSWNFTRIKWLGKFTAVVLVGFWIFFMSYLESRLGMWRRRKVAVANSRRLALWLIGGAVACVAIAQLFVLTIPT